MDGWEMVLTGLLAGFVISLVTAPVGVSGAVFLLPVQLDVLGVPSPQVTPTNLLYNLVAVPGALLRYCQTTGRFGPLTRTLVGGTLPGVIAGGVVRVEIVPDVRTFKLVAAVVLAGVGALVLRRPMGALPGFLVGLRFALTGAWLIMIIAEQINAREGIGFLMNEARAWYRTDIIVVGLVVYALLGLGTDAIIRTLERRLLAWRRGFTGA